MHVQQGYIELNREAWNKKVPYHVASAFYDQEGFMAGNSSLKSIELNLLGDIKGKSVLHLQCHFGQDTISLARMGAKVTGVDFSEAAISQANKLAEECGVEAGFVCCDIYELPLHLQGKFDIVFTSYGTIGWLPDLDKWAAIIKQYLKPGGEFVFVEFHPVMWMFDNDFSTVMYNYFKDDPIIEIEDGSYADTSAPIVTETHSWNHSMSEVITSLLRQDLKLECMEEFNYSPYNCFKHAVEDEPGVFRVKHFGNKLPLVYAIKARASAQLSS